jgi:TPR repeat protein
MPEKIGGGVNHLLTTIRKLGPSDRYQGVRSLGVNAMSAIWFETNKAGFTGQPIDATGEDLLVASCLAAAAQGDVSAYYDLGVAYSTGSHGAECDLIEAHKWFNLAAVTGHEEAALCRADISDEMTAREIAEAQRRAREWLSASSRKAA